MTIITPPAWNAVIGFPRYTAAASWSGGAWQAAYPVAGLGSLPLAKPARSIDVSPASTWFAASLPPAGVKIAMVVLCRHNLSVTARWRVRIYRQAGDAVTGAANPLWDSGWIAVWPVVYSPYDLEWEDDNWWSCTYLPAEIQGYPWYTPMLLPGFVLGAGVRVEIDDHANPAGFIDIGLCEIAFKWQISVNFSYGADYGAPSRSQVQEADGGAEYFRRRWKARTFTGTIDNLPDSEAQARAFEHQRQADIDQPFFWLPNPTDIPNMVRNAFLARHVELGTLKYLSFGRHSVPLKFKEVL